jgi:predicted TIM-barrel fold metal-dependent hydrolase
VLKRHPTLHLNLAHFGWSGAERYSAGGTGGKPPWVKQICEIVRDYPFAYTDVAHHEVFRPGKGEEFLSDYRLILRDYSGVIQKKLLFGIDWHVITRVAGYEGFTPAYLALLKENGLFTSGEIAGFLGVNALHFLGLLRKGTPPSFGWTKNRRRLGRFYQRNGITPPQWFTATGP